MKVAVIPARGGSKRIPGKNIKAFHGKPMLAWSIKAALSAGCFDKVIVSTDSKDIADVARSFGADAPFLRPEHLSDDFIGTLPVMQHAIHWLLENEQTPREICCIYPTAPFIRSADILKGLDVLHQSSSEFAVSVTSYPFPIQRAMKLDDQNMLTMVYPEHKMTRSQDLEERFHDAGQFYWGMQGSWLVQKQIFGDNTVPVYLPPERVVDIDTPEDWTRAEAMCSYLLG